LKTVIKEERANVTMLFAIWFIIISFFVGLAVDFGMYYMKKNDLENLCRVLREDRFTYQDSIRYAANPGAELYGIVSETMRKNGFDGKVELVFKEEAFSPSANSRKYKMRIILSQDFNFYFLRLFSLNSAKVASFVDGNESYGDGGTDVIWHPSVSPSSYNGTYTGSAGAGYTFQAGVYPSGW
jgi:hypothetical protein